MSHPPTLLPRLSLKRTRPLLSLAPLALLVLSHSARADQWTFSASGSGSASFTTCAAYGGKTYPSPAWAPPSPSVGSFTTGEYGCYTNDYSAAATASVTVTVKATWSGADPAPPTVWLCESSKSEWSATDNLHDSGSASDGLGPEYSATLTSGTADSSTAPTTTPPAYWHRYPVTNGVVTLPTRTVSASTSDGAQFGADLNAQVDSYSVSVHAQPYDIHLVGPPVLNLDGSVKYTFNWLSTDGNLNDLGTNISCYENVTYNGNPGTYSNTGPNGTQVYIPPDPPIANTEYQNPTVSYGGAASTGSFYDTQYMPDFAPPYIAVTYTGTQNYYFSDTSTGQVNVLFPGSVTFPILIVRQVSYDTSTDNWNYELTKLGYSNTIAIP